MPAARVPHLDPDSAVVRPADREHDRALARVCDGIRHEVRERALQQVALGQHRIAVADHLDRHVGARSERLGDLQQERPELDARAVQRLSRGLHAGQHEQRMGEPAEAIHLAAQIGEECVAILRDILGAGLQHLEGGVHRGERRQQLVRGVRDELALGTNAVRHLARRDEQEPGVVDRDRRERAVEREPVPVAMPEAELAEGRASVLEAAREGHVERRQVARMQQAREAAADEVLGVIPELLLVCRRRVQNGSLGIDERDELCDVVDNEAMEPVTRQASRRALHTTS